MTYQVSKPAGVHVSERTDDSGYRASAKRDELLLVKLNWTPAGLHATLTIGLLLLGLCPLLMVPWGGEAAVVGVALTVVLLPFSALMAYDTLGRRLNHTEIRVDPGSIVTCHRPLPWMGDKRVVANRIRDIEVHEQGQGAKHVCSVRVQLDDGRTDWLLRSNVSVGMNREQAEYIAQRIRAHLHLSADR